MVQFIKRAVFNVKEDAIYILNDCFRFFYELYVADKGTMMSNRTRIRYNITKGISLSGADRYVRCCPIPNLRFITALNSCYRRYII
jgi:hypothetical protein